MLILIFILGLVFGSFITAWSHRLVSEEAITKGRSHCPKCKKEIAFYDNIPLFSYLVLGGKCRHCHKKISKRYPLIELFTAISFVLVYLSQSILLGISCVFLITVLVTDIEHQLIFDEVVFWGILLTFTYLLFSGENLYPYLLSSVTGGLIFLFLYFATLGAGMGLGDVKLALWLGLSLKLKLLVVFVSASFMVGGIFSAILLLFGRAKLKQKIAFGPFMIIGYVVSLLWGDYLLTYLYGF